MNKHSPRIRVSNLVRHRAIRSIVVVLLALAANLPALRGAEAENLEQLLARADSLFSSRNLDSAIAVAHRAVQRAEIELRPDDTALASVLHTAGGYNYVSGRYDQAEALYRQALAIRQRQSDPDEVEIARELRSLGTVFYLRAQYSRAESTYIQSLGMMEDALGSDRIEVAKTLGNLSMVYVDQGHPEKALPLDKRALEINEAELGPAHPETARSLNHLATIYAGMSDYEQAERLYRRALKIREQAGQEDVGLISSLNNLANILKGQARYREASALFRRALAVSEANFGAEHRYTGSILNNLASSLSRQAHYAEAEELYTRALNILEISLGPDHPAVAKVLVSLADLMRLTGRFRDAESLMKRSLRIRETALGPAHPDVAASLSGLATLCRLQGKYAEAEPLHTRAISICREALGDDHPDVGHAIQGLANFRFRQGLYAEAESLYQQVLQIYLECFEPYHPDIGLVYQNLANLLHEQHRNQDAEELYRRALAISDSASGREHPRAALIMGNLGETLNQLGRLAEADSVITEALNIRRRLLGSRHRDVGLSLSSLSRLRLRQGLLVEAESLLAEAHSILTGSLGPSHPEVASLEHDMAAICVRSGRFDDALEHYERSLNLKHEFLEYAFSFSSEVQKLRWLKMYPLLDDAVLSLATLNPETESARLAATMVLNGKAAVVDAMMAEREAMSCSDDPDVQAAALLRTELGTRLANLALAAVSEDLYVDYGDTLAGLVQRIDSVETYLSRQCSEFDAGDRRRRASPTDVAGRLSEGTVLWEFIRYSPSRFDALDNSGEPAEPPRYLGMVLSPSGRLSLTDLGPAQRIDSLVHAARDNIAAVGGRVLSPLGAHLEIQYREQLQTLYDLVFLPMAAVSADAFSVYVSPDGTLNLFPLQVLPMDDGSYVIENYSITYLSSGRDLLSSSEQDIKPGKSALMIGDPDFDRVNSGSEATTGDRLWPAYRNKSLRPMSTMAECVDGGFARLNQGYEEIEAAAAILVRNGVTVRMCRGADAGEPALKNLSASPSILHIATHGFFCEDSTRFGTGHVYEPLIGSGLALAGANRGLGDGTSFNDDSDDGLLTALEASGLNLNGTDLAVLSACETGLGEVVSGEGVFGLRRAFQHAGVRSLVVSLWRAPDQQTRQLIGRFYEHWLDSDDRGEALRLAALEMIEQSRQDRGSAHPLLWGGFILVGDRH